MDVEESLEEGLTDDNESEEDLVKKAQAEFEDLDDNSGNSSGYEKESSANRPKGKKPKGKK